MNKDDDALTDAASLTKLTRRRFASPLPKPRKAKRRKKPSEQREREVLPPTEKLLENNRPCKPTGPSFTGRPLFYAVPKLANCPLSVASSLIGLFRATKAFQTTLNSPNGNAFLTRIGTTQSGTNSLVYSTFLGGSSPYSVNQLNSGSFGGDGASNLAIDGNQNAYLVGEASSTIFHSAPPLTKRR